MLEPLLGSDAVQNTQHIRRAALALLAAQPALTETDQLKLKLQPWPWMPIWCWTCIATPKRYARLHRHAAG